MIILHCCCEICCNVSCFISSALESSSTVDNVLCSEIQQYCLYCLAVHFDTYMYATLDRVQLKFVRLSSTYEIAENNIK